MLLSDHSFLSGFFGVRSAPSENLSPTSIKNNKETEILKSSKNQLPLIPVPDKEKQKDKNRINEIEKSKDKGKKDDEKKKDEKKAKLPDLQVNAKSPDSSFGSMDFDQNDLRRSTPNAEEIESAPKTTNPLLMNFIKNSNEQIGNQKNLEAIREETPDGKNKTPKVTPKTKVDTKDANKEGKDGKDSSRKEKKEKGSKKKEKKEDDLIVKDDIENDSLIADGHDENLFSIDPISDKKTDDETEKKKSKKAGKGKTKPKE